ncbi:MAG TPA: glycosyltransferase family A protein [Propionibacteriaceae bacterium]
MNPTDPPPRFSVVIPAYNEAGFLEDALRSLQAQDFAGAYEVIVVDNNSTDETAAIATRLHARVVPESHPGVCAARQRGTEAARGEIVVSTDADTIHPPDWLTRLDATFRAEPDAIAVAGPCRYQDPPWWAAVFPRLWFGAIAYGYAHFGRIFYLTATNVAFRRAAFPGYDTALSQGGDENDFLRRLRRRGPVVWDAANPVLTSSRRMDQGLLHTVIVSYGYHYALASQLNRLTSRTVLGRAPAIRTEHTAVVRRRRTRWRVGFLAAATSLAAWCWARSARRR